jgi:hypothetical protein
MDELFDTLCQIAYKDDGDFRQAVVFAAWEKTIGELRKKAIPVKLDQKNLIVAVIDEDWKNHFESISSKVIFKLNSLLKQPLVTSIDFYVDSAKLANLQESIQSKESKENFLDYVNTEIRQAADQIEDEDLRYNFLLAAGACLKRKRKLEEKDEDLISRYLS